MNQRKGRVTGVRSAQLESSSSVAMKNGCRGTGTSPLPVTGDSQLSSVGIPLTPDDCDGNAVELASSDCIGVHDTSCEVPDSVMECDCNEEEEYVEDATAGEASVTVHSPAVSPYTDNAGTLSTNDDIVCGSLEDIASLSVPDKDNPDDTRKCRSSTVHDSTMPRRNHGHLHHKRYRCEICYQSLVGYTAFSDHVRTVHPGVPVSKAMAQFTCEYCGTICWGSKAKLEDHIATKHLGHVHRCKICLKQYSSADSLGHHMRWDHDPNHHFICEVCGQEFNRKAGLRYHMRLQHLHLVPPEERIICTLCSKSLRNTVSLRLHMNSVHAADKKAISCPFCNYRCPLERYLFRHLRKHHPDKMEKLPDATSDEMQLPIEYG
jgi:RNase P subunit RPR2